MSIVLILFGMAGLVLLLAMGRNMSVLIASLLVVLTGTTFGHAFLNFDMGPFPVTIDRIMWAGLIFAALATYRTARTSAGPVNRTDILVILLTVVLVSSTLAHDWHYKDSLPMSRLLFFNLVPIGFYFVARHCQITPKRLTTFYVILAIFGLYLSLTAIFEQREIYALVFPRYILDPIYFEFLGRARGPFLNPVSCGFYLIVCMVSSAFLWPRTQPVGRVLIGISVVLCLVACALTLTRSVWLACAVVVGMLCWFPAKTHVRGTLILVGTLVLVLASLTMTDKINRFQRDKEVSAASMAESAALRPMLAYVALKMARDKPVFGHGFGQYTAAKKPYHYDETNDMQLSRVLPYMQHNVFLSYLTETGLVGMGLLILLLATVTFNSWQLWKSRSLALQERQFGLFGMAIVCTFLINGMFHDVSIIPHIGAIFYLTLGISENLNSSKCRMVVADITKSSTTSNPNDRLQAA